MDAGASPFVDVDELTAAIAEDYGIEEEDIDRTEQLDDVISRMHRQNFDDELNQALDTGPRQPYDVDSTAEEIE